MAYPKMDHLPDLLQDPSQTVRLAAAKATLLTSTR